MVELNNERIDEILHKETVKTEEQATILRAIYTRYMRLYEEYFAAVDTLDDAKIAELRTYHLETRNLVKAYYMDIPEETGTYLQVFDKEYTVKLLGPDWKKYVSESFQEFSSEHKKEAKNEDHLKEMYREEILGAFYDAMNHVFRDGFGTANKTLEKVSKGLLSILFGDDK